MISLSTVIPLAGFLSDTLTLAYSNLSSLPAWIIVRQTSCSIPFLHFISATEFVQVSLSCKVDWATMFICFARRQFLSPHDRQLVRSDVQSRTSAGAKCLSSSQRCLTCRVLFSSAWPIHGSSFHVQTILCQLDVVLSFTCQIQDVHNENNPRCCRHASCLPSPCLSCHDG